MEFSSSFNIWLQYLEIPGFSYNEDDRYLP